MPIKTKGEKQREKEERNAERLAERRREKDEKKSKFEAQFGTPKPIKKEKKPWDPSDDDDDDSSGSGYDESSDSSDDERTTREKYGSRKAWQRRFTDRGGKQEETILVIAPPATTTNSSGRLVMNHSTHCDGLIEVLRRLVHKLDERFTITPGIVSQSQSSRDGVLVIEMQRSDQDTCLNLVAKKGSTLQGIAIQKPAEYDPEKLFCLVQEALEHTHEAVMISLSGGDALLEPALNNKVRAEALDKMAEVQMRERGHQQKLIDDQARRDEKKAASVAEREKKLIRKVGRANAAKFAARDDATISGETRTRNSRI